MRFEGKIAIVTGGGSGFGEGIAKKFVAEGANARSLRIDVTNAADVKRMLEAAHDFFGGLHIQVSIAVVAKVPQPLDGLPEDIGNAACYLCSDEASMVTGVAMEVDGGRCV